jgi:hypothetical protein
MISRPWFWALIPTSIMFNPHFNDLGVYGFTMSAVSVFYSYSPVPEMIFKGGVEAPTISIFRMNGDLLQERDWFIGVGASLKADVFMRFSDRMLLSSGWTSAFYLPGNDTEITFYDGESEKVWHIGTIDLQLHYRFAYMRK